jgi:hypothetical protein
MISHTVRKAHAPYMLEEVTKASEPEKKACHPGCRALEGDVARFEFDQHYWPQIQVGGAAGHPHLPSLLRVFTLRPPQ